MNNVVPTSKALANIRIAGRFQRINNFAAVVLVIAYMAKFLVLVNFFEVDLKIKSSF